ncbi:tripartite tricarboxylate transporter substrate binding protein [Dysosmobacter welbionis]|uniref:tripartite tricarboxylate transporter substrate binding protein n=2 Tax=Oscillospiraceae TaxID=216572 RepID=UPI003990EF3A
MKTWKKLFSLFCAAVMMCSLLAGCGNSPDTPADDASSEDGGTDWPTKSINMIVPMGAGGDTDFNARTYAKYLEDVLGETVVVTNITGNGGALGSEEVKNASPDGYTCLFYHTCLNINQATGIADYGSEAFETVAVVGKSSGEAVVVRADAPYGTMEELIAYSQANPQTVKIAANTGATSHWASVVLNVEEDAQLNIVNASSSAERVANLLGGQLDVIINPIGTVQDYVTSGDFKYLAVTTSERLDYLPDVPTCLEQGVNLSYDLMYYVMFPKGTDPAICQKFAQAFKEISEMPEYAEEIKTAYNQTPYFLDTEESIAYIQEENEKMMAYADYFK